MNLKLSIVLILIALQLPAYAQEIQNIWISRTAGSITIDYDLVSDYPEAYFDVNLYSSLDGYKTAISAVQGDVGRGIPIGPGKKIIWDISATEFPEFNQVEIEIRALVHSPLVLINELGVEKKVRRGKVAELSWQGGELKEIYSIELVDSEGEIQYVGNTLNNQSFNWDVPADLDLKKMYQIKLIDISDPERYSLSNNFQVKRKFPWALRIGAAAAVVGLTAIIINATNTNNSIPDPPGTPN